MHYLWDSSKGTHARLEMWIQTGGLHGHLHSKFSQASETFRDIQFSDNQLTEYSVIQVLQFRWDGVSGGFQTTNGPHYRLVQIHLKQWDKHLQFKNMAVKISEKIKYIDIISESWIKLIFLHHWIFSPSCVKHNIYTNIIFTNIQEKTSLFLSYTNLF